LKDRQANNQKAAKPWFDSRCRSASLYPFKTSLNNIISHLGTKKYTRRGGLAMEKDMQIEPFCAGVMMYTEPGFIHTKEDFQGHLSSRSYRILQIL